MLNWIVGSSLKFRFIVLAGAATMVFFGLDRLRKSPVDVFPEFAPPIVAIQTPSLGLSPEEVEELVTVPLEDALAGLPDLAQLRSKSVPHLSEVKLYFKRGTDLLLARQMVQERISIARGNIPPDIGPPFIMQPLSATSRMLKIGITSEKHSVIDLSMIAYWKIQQRLKQVPGVAHVAIWGERLKMLQVQVEPERLAANGTHLQQVMDVMANSLDAGLLRYSPGSIIGTGGWIETPNQRLPIRHILPIQTPPDLAEVAFDNKWGERKKLGEIAEVKEDHQPLVGDGIVEEEIGLLLIVEKFPWANTLQVTKGIDEALDAIRPGLPDVTLDAKIFRPATYIQSSIDNLSKALLLGCFLVVVILCAFLYEWRVALISCTAIPLSLVAGGLVLYLRGEIINTMILAGFVIALGVIVDDAIVDIENIVRRLREARKEGRGNSIQEVAKIVFGASIEVRHAIIYSTLIELLVLVPVFLMEGLSGAFFRPLAMSYAMAVGASTIVALTVTPAMGLVLLRNAPLERRESPLFKLLRSSYTKILGPIIRSPKPAYGLVGVVILAGLVVLPQLGQQLLPSFKERDFLMHWLAKPGCSLPEEDRITIQSAKELRHIPGIQNFGAHIGQALIMDEVVGIYFGENWVSVDPSVPYQETIDAIQTAVDGYPGLFRDVLTYLKERIREVLTGSSEAITCRIYGRDLHTLHDLAMEVEHEWEGVEGVIDLHAGHQEDVPHIKITTNLDACQAVGLKPGDVRRQCAILINGQEMGDIFYDGKAYDVQLWSTPKIRHSLTSLQELLIDTPAGGHVRLDEIADVRVVPTPNVIKRYGMMRYLDVGCNVRGRDIGSVQKDVQAAISKIDFPTEYHWELLGEYTERQAATKKMQVWAFVALAETFVLLSTSFGSARLGILAFTLLPMALVGGLIAAYIGGGIISLGSLVGFLTVFGVSARNGILMINHFQHLQRYEGEKFGPEMVLRGAKERVAPIVMTATTTGLALLPLVLAGDIPGHEIELPMAVVILGGLITSTLLNLFVLPSLYLRWGRPEEAVETVTDTPPESPPVRAYG